LTTISELVAMGVSTETSYGKGVHKRIWRGIKGGKETWEVKLNAEKLKIFPTPLCPMCGDRLQMKFVPSPSYVMALSCTPCAVAWFDGETVSSLTKEVKRTGQWRARTESAVHGSATVSLEPEKIARTQTITRPKPKSRPGPSKQPESERSEDALLMESMGYQDGPGGGRSSRTSPTGGVKASIRAYSGGISNNSNERPIGEILDDMLVRSAQIHAGRQRDEDPKPRPKPSRPKAEKEVKEPGRKRLIHAAFVPKDAEEAKREKLRKARIRRLNRPKPTTEASGGGKGTDSKT